MNLKQLEYVIAIAEEHSISGAAKRLYLSPSALSQYLSRLESEEHLPPLFRKEKGTCYLTDAGRIYVNGARTILGLSAKMEHDLKNRHSLVRLVLAPVFEYPFLTMVLPRFGRDFPETRLSVSYCSSAQAKNQLDEGQADAAAILDQQKSYSSFWYLPIYEDQVVWAVGRGAFLEEDNACVRSFPVILPPRGTFWRGTCDDILSQEQFAGDVYCETTDLNAIAALLSGERVTAFLLESNFRGLCKGEEGGSENLKMISLSRRYPYYISVLTPLNQAMSPALEGLVRLLAEYLNPFCYPVCASYPVYRRL